jgi:hypothetical protein
MLVDYHFGQRELVVEAAWAVGVGVEVGDGYPFGRLHHSLSCV